MNIHELKSQLFGFNDLLEGRKHHEWRRNDRGYFEGDLLVLREWDPDAGIGETKLGDNPGRYTGRVLIASVDFIQKGDDVDGLGLPPEWCVMEVTLHAFNTGNGRWGGLNRGIRSGFSQV